jgi:hypothetical protein
MDDRQVLFEIAVQLADAMPPEPPRQAPAGSLAATGQRSAAGRGDDERPAEHERSEEPEQAGR